MNKKGNKLQILRQTTLSVVFAMLFGSCASSTAVQHAPERPVRDANLTTLSLTLITPPSGTDESATRAKYQQLAKYIETQTGKHIEIVTPPNYLAYWHTVQDPTSYDLALDSAHFTDYRIQEYGFRLLAKQAGLQSYSVLTTSAKKISALHQLAGRVIAARDIPSMDATRLSAMFSDPSRQPRIHSIANYDDGLELLANGRIAAVVIPTQYAFELSKLNSDYKILAITEPVIAGAMTASPALDPVTQRQIQRALLQAASSPMGRTALASAELANFIPGNKQQYEGYRQILAAVWSY
ncbi:MAG: PhnD/SsuA/transferrin family substrate-binding protein [Proteobacteria bacterium]|nr:PhnD/SsuA/transferrin family substrate-binding protein [Pseudomonadota bacterium]